MANRDASPARPRAPASVWDGDPFLALHRDIDRLFENFGRWNMPALNMPATFSGAHWPSIDVEETDKEYRISAEFPGLDKADVEIMLDGDVLLIGGEKRVETEDRERKISARSYGRFERRIPLGAEIDGDKVAATLDKGVLTVTLPKNPTARDQRKTIAIKG